MSKTDDGLGNPFEVFRPDSRSPARIYDYLLGGKDHFPADREMAEEVANAFPPGVIRGLARQNRAFLRRAVRYLVAETDVRQFIDIGAGLPTVGPVHEIAQSFAPESRVVYVDNDMVVVAHSWEMLSGVENATIIRHDLRRPEDILADPELQELIDFGRPVAVLLVAIMHYISDADDPAGIICRLLDPLPAGSHLVLSHGTHDTYPEQIEIGARIFQRATTTGHSRTRVEVAGLLDGLELVEPGLVWVPQWRPDPDTGMQGRPEKSGLYAAVARKTHPLNTAPSRRAQARRADTATRGGSAYGSLARQQERPPVPRSARVYDHLLGGNFHYPADRYVADEVIKAFPPGVVRAAARHNREFVHRAVQHLAGDVGIRQFIDIGAGFATAASTEHVHEVVQAIAPDTRVVYLDNDATVVAFAREAFTGANNTAVARHDLRAPEDILDDLGRRELIDFDEPVAVVLGAVLHYISPADDPADIINRLVGPLATGSHLVISHATGDTYPTGVQAAEEVYGQTSTPLHTRTKAEVARLLHGLDLIEPGLVWAPQWRPASTTDTQDNPENTSIYVAVAYKH